MPVVTNLSIAFRIEGRNGLGVENENFQDHEARQVPEAPQAGRQRSPGGLYSSLRRQTRHPFDTLRPNTQLRQL